MYNMSNKLKGDEFMGNKVKKPIYKRVWFWVLAIILLASIGNSMGSDKKETTTKEEQKTETVAKETTEKKTKENKEPINEPEPAKPTATVSQKNAVRKAEMYLKTMAFSRDGLVQQLEFEKYPTEDAIYAVDNITVDWNEQAAKKAKQYLDSMPFSRDDLIRQLEFEKFTNEQAVYGVSKVGL